MVTELKFSQNAYGKWETVFTASGDRMGIEVNRDSSGPLLVLAGINGLKAKQIQDFGPNADSIIIFEIDVPAEIEITIISFTEVIAAKVTGV